MTFCKQLAEKEVNGKIVSASMEQEKFCNNWNYLITVRKKDSPIVQSCDIYRVAKTTWKKKFKEVCENEQG